MTHRPHLSLLCLLVGVACNAQPPQPGLRANFDDFCDAKFDLPPDAKADTPLPRMTLEGYLVPPTMFSLCSDTCSFDLAESPEPGARSIRYSVKIGGGPNRLEKLPERFESADFKLETHDGRVLGFGDRVRLTGQRLGDSREQNCQLYKVDLVEAG